MRLGNWPMNQGDSSRMYPARQTRSTLCSSSAATIKRSCSSRGMPFEGITSACNPRRRADSIPRASALFEITTAIVASSLPKATLSAMASKFEPRPERRMPRLRMICVRIITTSASIVSVMRPFAGFLEKVKQIRIYLVFIRGAHAVGRAAVDLQHSALHQPNRQSRGIVDGHDLIVVPMQDQCRHIDLPEVVGLVRFRNHFYAIVSGFDSAQHALQPEEVAQTL